jgi:hypothetical protein
MSSAGLQQSSVVFSRIMGFNENNIPIPTPSYPYPLSPGAPDVLIMNLLTGHTDTVLCIISLGDDRIASGSMDQTVRVWNTTTGLCLRTLTGHTGVVGCVASLSADRLASGSNDNTIRIWNTTSGQLLHTLIGHTESVWSITDIGADRLASASHDNTVRVWNTTSGELLRTLMGHTDWVTSVTSLGEDRLASASRDNTVRIWNATTGICLRILTEHTKGVDNVIYLGDDSLASASQDRTIRIWNATTGECTRRLMNDGGWPISITYFGNYILAAAITNNSMYIWDIRRGIIIKLITIDTSDITYIGNNRMAIVRSDDMNNILILQLNMIEPYLSDPETHIARNTVNRAIISARASNQRFNNARRPYQEGTLQITPICDKLGFSQHIGECWVDSIQELFFFTDGLKEITQLLFYTLKDNEIAQLIDAGIGKNIIRLDDRVRYINGFKSMRNRFIQHYNFIRFNEAIRACDDPRCARATHMKAIDEITSPRHQLMKRTNSAAYSKAVALATQSNEHRTEQLSRSIEYIDGETLDHEIQVFRNILGICNVPFRIETQTTRPVLAIGIVMKFITGTIQNNGSMRNSSIYRRSGGGIVGHATGFLRCDNRWYYYDNNYGLFQVTDAFITELLRCLRENIPIGIDVRDRQTCHLYKMSNVNINIALGTIPTVPTRIVHITHSWTEGGWEDGLFDDKLIRLRSGVYDYDGWSIIYGAFYLTRIPPSPPKQFTSSSVGLRRGVNHSTRKRSNRRRSTRRRY